MSHAGLPPTPLPPRPVSPVLGAVHERHHRWAYETVHHESNQAGQGDDDVRHSADHGQRHVSSRSIRPGTAVPITVFVTHLPNGGLLLCGFGARPRAYLSPSDATPLRRELVAAFGSRESARRGEQGELR